jgi:periplasmic divalent cation tolerance protein
MNPCVVLVTTPDEECAKELAKHVLEQNLCACVSIQCSITSLFHWEGKIQEEKECMLIIKSTLEAFNGLESCIKSHHPYDVPEIISLPIVKGHEPYLSWLKESVKKEIK